MDASELMRLMASLPYLWFFCDDSQVTELDSFADALEKIEHEPFIIFAERLTQPEDSSGDLLQEEEEDSPARMRRLLARVENSSDDLLQSEDVPAAIPPAGPATSSTKTEANNNASENKTSKTIKTEGDSSGPASAASGAAVVGDGDRDDGGVDAKTKEKPKGTKTVPGFSFPIDYRRGAVQECGTGSSLGVNVVSAVPGLVSVSGGVATSRVQQFRHRIEYPEGSDILFCEEVAQEAQAYRDQCLSHYKQRRRDGFKRGQMGEGPGHFPCLLCPSKHFKHSRDLLNHVTNQHVVDPQDREKKSIRHPLRGFVEVARGLFNDIGSGTSEVPAPWELGEVQRQKTAKVPAKPPSAGILQRTAKLVRRWNQKHMESGPAEPRKGFRREAFRIFYDVRGF